MATIVLSNGVIRSMTRGAPRGMPLGEPESDKRLSLMDKLNLLRLIAEDPPPQLKLMVDQLRQGKEQVSSTVFSRLRSLIEGDFEDFHESDPEIDEAEAEDAAAGASEVDSTSVDLS